MSDFRFKAELRDQTRNLRAPFESLAAQLGPSFEQNPPDLVVADLDKGRLPAEFVHETAVLATWIAGKQVDVRFASLQGSRRIPVEERHASITELVRDAPLDQDAPRVVIATEATLAGKATTEMVEGFAKLGIVADLAVFQSGRPPSRYRERLEALTDQYGLARNPQLFVGEQTGPGLPGEFTRPWAFTHGWWAEAAGLGARFSPEERERRAVIAGRHLREFAHDVYPTSGRRKLPPWL